MKLTKEQKEAIEELSKKAVICNYEERDYPNMICFKKDMIIILNLIEKLQKENKELKEENEYNKLLLELNNNFTIDKKTGNYKWNVIEIQKIKDKIEELNKEIKSCTEIDAIFKIKQQQILQELLGDK